MKPWFLIALACAVFTACGTGADFSGPPAPEGVIPRDTFVHVLTEVHLIEGAYKQRLFRNDDAEERALGHYAEVYERWDIDEARFLATYTWWYQQPEAMDGLLEEVAERLTELEREIVDAETADSSGVNASQNPMPPRRREQ